MEIDKTGFSANQIEEIEKGLEKGLDTAVYARKEFLAIQMRQIRLGLMEKLPVEVYAREEYDWFQMEEIRLGLKEGMDVSRYRSSEIPYDKMRQMRLGLMDGTDLSVYLDRPAGIMGEIRQALHSGIDLTPYIKEGYEADQLEQIRIALERGNEINDYLTVEFRGASIREIRYGLEKNLDISCYAKTECNWQQMRQMRLGIEHRVDAGVYQSPLYSWQQMFEIRLGLESGLDVSAYKSLMYTPSEMKKRRQNLLQQTEEKKNSNDSLEICPLEEYEKFHVYLSEDKMKAYIQVLREVSLEEGEIRNALAKNGITGGIKEEVIQDMITGVCAQKVFVVAVGSEPQNGNDGRYEFFFRTEWKYEPKLLEDGSVDYQNTECFEMVHEGQTIAYYHRAEDGTDGYTVTGKALLARRGREQGILTGEGFKLQDDARTYIAQIGGKIEMIGNYIKISNVLVVNEVTSVTGNIDFDGSVFIRGAVSSGVMIRTTEDLIVDGYVEAAMIDCGGNVTLRRGMNGAGRGTLRAGGDVRGNFLEAVQVRTLKGIYVNYALNATLSAEDKIVVSGYRGSLIGGFAQAAKGLDVYAVGNQKNCETFVRLGVSESLNTMSNQLKEEMKSTQEELHILMNAQNDYQRKYSPEQRNAMKIYLKIEDAIYTKNVQTKEQAAKKDSIQKEMERLREAKAYIKGKVYEGATIEISGMRWRAKEVQDITVKNTGERLAVYMN